MKKIIGALLLLQTFSIQALSPIATWEPTELIIFGSSATTSVPENTPIPNYGDPAYPRKLAELLDIEGMSFGRPGFGTSPGQKIILMDDYLGLDGDGYVHANPITAGTIHILGPFNRHGTYTIEQQQADIVEMVNLLINAGAEHIFIPHSSLVGGHSLGFRFAGLYKLAVDASEGNDPNNIFDDGDDPYEIFNAFVTPREDAALIAAKAAFEAILAGLDEAERSRVKMLDYITFSREYEQDPEKYGVASKDFYECFNNTGAPFPSACIEHLLYGAGAGFLFPDARVPWSDGVHLSFYGNDALADYIANIILWDAQSVSCNDQVIVCGHSVKVLCGGDIEGLTGGLRVDDRWQGIYDFYYQGETEYEICSAEFFSDTVKLEAKCTDALKGNSKNYADGSEILIEMEMKYDESKDNCSVE